MTSTASSGTRDSKDSVERAYSVALDLLEPPITELQIGEVVAEVAAMSRFKGLDTSRLQRLLESRVSIQVPDYQVLDDGDFKAWVAEARSRRAFAFWNRYRNWLARRRQMSEDVLRHLNRLTDDVLDRLRDPDTAGSWDRRGLVVGDVQAGKTGNYIGLACKAIDAGYPLVIVLAGIHDNLRSQTQIRFDKGLLGRNTRLGQSTDGQAVRIGVGEMPETVGIIHCLTTSHDDGDFKRDQARKLSVVPGGNDPMILVVKKNVSILRNLIRWVLSVAGEDSTEHPGSRVVRNVPLLVIDDEADHASVNTDASIREDGTPDPETDPSETNKLVRELLTAFEKSAYVGYTATPFANVFMHHEEDTNLIDPKTGARIGKGLFPRSFILNMKAPDNHVGPEKVFGIGPGGETGPAVPPSVVPIEDAQACFPHGHKKTLQVLALPPSLDRAMLTFLLVAAARRARGQDREHNSMLIHVTRFTDVQEQIASLVEEFMYDVRRQLEYPGTGGHAVEDLKALWEEEFEAKAGDTAAIYPDKEATPVSWTEVHPHLTEVAVRLSVRRINGSAGDVLDYEDHPDGLTVIAVGGEKLSRGLTLEGLSVSYFTRPARMYDTLMQMGRWFGYRPGYGDLCRLYTTRQLVGWHQHVALATNELRSEFGVMVTRGCTPLEYGLRVQTHPAGLLITAANKMKAVRKVMAGFSGSRSETVAFDLRQVDRNYQAFDTFLRSLPAPDIRDSLLVWNDRTGAEILDLIRDLRTPAASWKARPAALAEYIAERMANGRLIRWTVAIKWRGEGGSAMVGGQAVRMVKRDRILGSEPDTWSIKVLVDPKDEGIDLDPGQWEEARQATGDRKGKEEKVPGGPEIRSKRTSEQGLLLIYPVDPRDPSEHGKPLPEGMVPLMGFAVSFPYDKEGKMFAYAENSVRQLEELLS